MRLVDLLDYISQPASDLTDLAVAFQLKVQQLCAIAARSTSSHTTTLLGSVAQQQDDDDSLPALKRIKVAQDIDIEAGIASVAQLTEFIESYTGAIADSKQNSRALASFTESLLVSLTHLALTPAIFVDLQGDTGGAGLADHRSYTKAFTSSIAPFIKHILDNASFVKRSVIDGSSPLCFYGFSVFYALANLPSIRLECLHSDHQGWYTLSRTLKEVLKKATPAEKQREAMEAVGVIHHRPMAHNIEFGISPEYIATMIQSLESILSDISCASAESSNTRILIDALLLLLPMMPDQEKLYKKWYNRRHHSSDRKSHLTMNHLRVIGLAASSKFRLYEKYLLSANGTGLLEPLLSSTGHANNEYDDMIYQLLKQTDSVYFLRRCMTFLSDTGITNISQKIFSSFDAKLWLAWMLALTLFPRRKESERRNRKFPTWDAKNVEESDEKLSTSYKLQSLILEPISKQIQLQLQRRSHSGCEIIALLICALCAIEHDETLWRTFAVTNLQDITMNCVLKKFSQDEGTVEVFGKAVSITSDPGEDVIPLLLVYKKQSEEVKVEGIEELQSMLRTLKADGVDQSSFKIELVLDLFERISDILGHANIVNLTKIDLSKLPDLILVRLFEISMKLTTRSTKSLQITSKMCAAVAKKISQYFIMIDKLNNPELNETYIKGLTELLQVVFKLDNLSGEDQRVNSDRAYAGLARTLIGPHAQVIRTFLSAVLNTYVNNRLVFAKDPTNDAFLNILLHFFDDARKNERRSDVKLSNYRHSDVSPEKFLEILSNLLQEIILIFCIENYKSMSKKIWPTKLIFDAVGDTSFYVVYNFRGEARAQRAQTSSTTEMEGIEEVCASAHTHSGREQESIETREPCQCQTLLDWLRQNRKSVSSDYDMQRNLVMKLSATNGFDEATKRSVYLETLECSVNHQESFKMMCSIWSDIMRDGLLETSLFVEFLKFSPKVIGRNMSERQNSIVKALGLCLLGDEVPYTLWGPDNQFDFRQLVAERRGNHNKQQRPDLTAKAPEKRHMSSIRVLNPANIKVLFGDWYYDFIESECQERKGDVSVALSILLDLLIFCLRMMYASVPLGNRPEKLLAMDPDATKKASAVYDPVIKMLMPAKETDDEELMMDAYPLLCEASESVTSRRKVLSLLHSNKIMNCFSHLLTLKNKTCASIVSESFEIIQQLLVLELYREKAFQLILKDPRPKLSRVLDHILIICSRLAFIRRNIIIDDHPPATSADHSPTLAASDEPIPYLLRCIPAVLSEADNGNWLFESLITSYICVADSKAGDFVSSDLHLLLWNNLMKDGPSIIRFCEKQMRSSESYLGDSILESRMTACARALKNYMTIPPHN